MSASRTPGPARGSRPSALLVVALVALGILLASPSVASAHDGLVGSSPGAGETVATAPSAVELRFSGTPLPLGTEVVVTGPDGGRIDRGAPEIRDDAVVQPLADAPDAGTYTVQWRSTSADGHPISGSFAFGVTGDGAGGGAAPAPAGSAPAAEPGPAGGGTAFGGLAAGAVGAGALSVLGLLLARRLRGRA
ncbi:copper resistance CopC family protein [Blastococcus xanthinilyticus]|uniref:CopC domain-containing protein n=1 Tax=Blastococcus xanthinilyticus TaxID=1564164 RepID=A0A5S5D391_9ACTN|nr:copper resistance CopC family protein [Blastococcus xanthinilyticus]TYP89089.1 hypothetical protein BD833_103246 [Blastococcus xanthinilyticus]